MGDNYENNYDIVDIAKNFHELTHRTLNLQKWENTTFDPDQKDYLISVGMFAVWPITTLVAVLVIYLLTSIFMCCCCSGDRKKQSIRIEFKVFIGLVGLVCGLSFIAGLYGDWELHTGIQSVKNASTDVVDWFNEVKDNTTNILESVKAIDGDIGDLGNILKKAKEGRPPQVATALQPYINDCDTISNSLKGSNSELTKLQDAIKKANIDMVPGYIDDYGNIFCIVVLVLLLVLAIIGLIFTFAYCSRCLLGCFVAVAVLSLIICSLIVAITLVASVATSDLCYGVKPWARKMIDDKDVSEYIIDCIKDNAVSQYVDEATTEVKNALGNFTKFNSISKTLETYQLHEEAIEVGEKHDHLLSQLVNINGIMYNFGKLVECKRSQDVMNESLTAICTNGIKGVVLIFFNTVVSSFCFTLLVFVSTFALR